MNRTASPVEHYVTLFDNNFLPLGLCLHASLMRHGGTFVLWVVCMDEAAERNLRALDLPHVRLIPLAEAETSELQATKQTRSRGEYCWTVTPFAPDFVFARDPAAARVTYLDADLFFFASPAALFAELDSAHKDVLITEHAFAPEYESSDLNGRFCVQFVTFRRTPQAAEVLRWWQARCIEWCYNRHEDGKFGDQKYLDRWPVLFGNAVHILQDKTQALAPWNAEMQLALCSRDFTPAFYHFHGLRVIASDRVKLFGGHKIGATAMRLYRPYVEEMHRALQTLRSRNIPVPVIPEPAEPLQWARRWKRRLTGIVGYASV